MYQIFRKGVSMGIVDTLPTQEQLTDLNCDSYEEYIEPEETSDAKKIRIFASLISTPDLSSVDLEGITFSDIEIGDIIVQRVFNGNPHAQTALIAKTMGVIMKLSTRDELSDIDISIINKSEGVRKEINKIRNKLFLQSI